MQAKFIITHKHFTDDLLSVNYYNRWIMNFVRVPLARSEAGGSISGKSKLPEGAT